jgi:serine/threonine protein kinase
MTERFTLLTELGRGGMGVVWKARDEETGLIVALKLLRETYAEDHEYLARFERELELAKRIDSINVVKVFGFGVRQKVPYLALEYVDGPSLHDALAKHGPYNWPETKALLIQLTQGLADANAAGVIHRDVKPANVLIGPDGIAKLTDFGIARGLDSTRMTATSTMLGTPAYLAPEGPKDARSDLYSLGIIGFQLLAGQVPFKGTSHQEVIFEHVRTAPDLDALPPEARPMIGWLLAKDPTTRPQSAVELLGALQDPRLAPRVSAAPRQGVGSYATVPSGPVDWADRNSRTTVQRAPAGTRRSAPVFVSLGIAGVLGIVVVAAIILSSFRSSPTQGPGTTRDSGLTGAPVAAANHGTFTPTGSMIESHNQGTATLLKDGRVLIAGDEGVQGSFGIEAELYDPATGTFEKTGSMHGQRARQSATLLNDGRVLIAGGAGENNEAELYDPKTGTFAMTGPLTTAREMQSATLLQDGRVLIAGGTTPSTAMESSAEVYDPKTGTFSPTGPMKAHQLDGFATTLLLDGRVLVVGSNWSESGDAELYDPKTGTFSLTGSTLTPDMKRDYPFEFPTATTLDDGRVLLAGGYAGGGNSASSAELYDPKSGTFSPTGSLSVGRLYHRATKLADGRVLIVGGDTAGTAEIYDPNTGAFTATGLLTIPRNQHMETLLLDGRVLVAGGLGVPTRAEIYTP